MITLVQSAVGQRLSRDPSVKMNPLVGIRVALAIPY
jgi:hypothetical protein